MTRSARVLGVGAACPLGLTTRAAFAAVEAGIRRFVEIDGVFDLAGEPARGCRLQSLAGEDPFERALWFARRAAAQALRALAYGRPEPVPVFVAVPAVAHEAGRSRRLKEVLTEVTPPAAGLRWTPRSLLADGRASGAVALAAALHELHDGAPRVLVGGLDCLVAGDALRELSRHNRLLGRRNCDGRLPGEGAAFLLLGRASEQTGSPALGVVEAVVCAQEPAPFAGESASRAAGLTEVLADLREHWPRRVDEVVAAQSNERFFATELSTAYLRNVELMPEPMRVRALADALGDCGASAFPLGLAWALDDFDLRARWRGSLASAVVLSSSDAGTVGGALVTAATGESRAVRRSGAGSS
ncbi:3-oxoacyl-ACP synthase [Nannocystis pusilla]|uniref:3-oxoacyl-ACP synthase n=1 Tax=Nannocystis pusilla TaxID=889268 RepID=UPI003BF1CE46